MLGLINLSFLLLKKWPEVKKITKGNRMLKNPNRSVRPEFKTPSILPLLSPLEKTPKKEIKSTTPDAINKNPIIFENVFLFILVLMKGTLNKDFFLGIYRYYRNEGVK